jgi:ATP-dependent Clp protease adapter protein ClpS
MSVKTPVKPAIEITPLEEVISIDIPGLKVADPSDPKLPHLVKVLNNDTTTYDETMKVLQEATECSERQALKWTTQIDKEGSAIVFRGTLKKCTKVCSIINKVGLQTEILDS